MERERKEDQPLMLTEQTFPIIEQITAGMPGGFFIYHADEKEELIYANRALIHLYGCETLKEFLAHTGGTFPGMIHPEDRQATADSIREQIAVSCDNLDYVEYRTTATLSTPKRLGMSFTSFWWTPPKNTCGS